MSSVLPVFHVFLLLLLSCFITQCNAFRALRRSPLASTERSKAVVAKIFSTVPLDQLRGSSSANNSITATTDFQNFDYYSHWYPVIWERDLILNRPTKVTLFDVDYAIAKTAEGEVMALLDACSHKSASLSEGRVTSCSSFQCAYHGWTFNGTTGQCKSIPQVNRKLLDSTTDRANAVAIPAQVVQGCVWIFPGGKDSVHQHPPPPRIPDLENSRATEYRILGPILRDFPIDWTVLVENIMDPDHGLFAHQTTGFDLYSASKDHSQAIVEDIPLNGGKGWTITSSVDAVYKVLQKKEDRKEISSTAISSISPLKATTRYVAPCTIWMGRINAKTNQTSFFNVFYVSPSGTGKSRFMSASYAKIPKFIPLPPRWWMQIAVNNFLDQDTQLLATQQRHVLATESQLALEAEPSSIRMNTTAGVTINDTPLPVRKRLYVYRSPSERLGVRIGAFFDATVKRVPNRLAAIRDLGGYDRVMRQAVPPREIVLDRYQQHTVICPDSATFLRNCQIVRRIFQVIALVPVLTPLVLLPTMLTATAKASSRITILSSIQRIYTKFPGLPVACSVVSALISFVAHKLAREFFFKYNSSFRNRDLDKIPKLHPDS
jgi:phenylpropionate dioxygenase-like ring-hydroxylating dioxygenase large terminal subunit